MTNWGRLAVFDLETTGIDVESARIVSACVAVLEPDGSLVERWDWLADPGIEIPEGASAVHGITTERAQALGRPAREVVAEITQALRVLFGLGMPLVVYNAPYDLSLLDRECRRHSLVPLRLVSPVIDPLVLDKAMDKYRKGKRTLEVTADRYGVSLDDAHDAGADAIAAGRVAQSLVRAYPDELDIPATDLHGRQEVWFAEQSASFADYIRNVKGDMSFVADDSWPLRANPNSLNAVDTQPIPAPAPRLSRKVPYLDFETGVLELPGGLPMLPGLALEESVAPTAGTAETVAPPQRHSTLRVAAGIITDTAGRTLLVRKRGTSAFMQAGGKIEAGESALQALTRELQEELGFQVDLDATEYIGSFRAEAANEPDTIIRAEVFALTTDRAMVPGQEIEQMLWIDTDEPVGIELAPLTRDTILPLWVSRRSALF
ncbi:MAG: NUDIX domain-containing protein [Salinibacterium sp.]|nr:NUDIX domain-containing protein [Salinibacterium sp.]